MPKPCDVDKQREITFHPLPPGQIERAVDLLGAIPKLVVTRQGTHTLKLAYCVSDYTLQELETLLAGQGFHIEAPLLVRIKRALVYYTERVQRENLVKPETQTKKFKPHVEAWDKNPHGDHDATPEEWRQYK